MNAPMQNPQPPPMPPAGATGGYPSGAQVVGSEAGADGMVDNPVIAGFQSIMMFVKELMNRGDPRGQQAAQHVAGLLQVLQGAPMDSPMPPPAPEGMPPEGMPLEATPPQAAPQPLQAAPEGEPPIMPGGPAPEAVPPQGMAFDPFKDDAPPEPKEKPKAGSKQMNTQQMPRGAKAPVVLT